MSKESDGFADEGISLTLWFICDFAAVDHGVEKNMCNSIGRGHVCK